MATGGYDLGQVWLVVSPQNPLKQKETLANDYARLDLVRVAIGDLPYLKASDIEFKMSQPSYTIDTLTVLGEQYPQHEFVLLMGGDNLISLPKWKNYELLLERYKIYVYLRPGYVLDTPLASHPNVRVLNDVPQINLSASMIRTLLRAGKSIRFLVPDSVHEELMRRKMY
jgi:nicotinate-nucleotide adenylyltransferase